MSTITETDVTRDQLASMAADYLADPRGWPAAMAARAVRLAAGHPAYSPGNMTLIVSQLWARFESAGMLEDDAFTAAMQAMSEETAPASVWRKRGYEPDAGRGLAIWSKPITVYTDAAGNRAYRADKLEDVTGTYRAFTVERTYLARDVQDSDGNDGRTFGDAPDMVAGDARDTFDRLAAWITGQGWAVRRSGVESREDGRTNHAAQTIMVHGGLAEWSAVSVLAHEIAHALLHGANDDRPYAGEHRGDMEAEAEAVAFGLMVAMGQHERARESVAYVSTWTRDTKRIDIAYERACHVTDAITRVALGESDVTVTESGKAEKAAAKVANRDLAGMLRDAGIEPRGEAWKLAKAGATLDEIRKVGA